MSPEHSRGWEHMYAQETTSRGKQERDSKSIFSMCRDLPFNKQERLVSCILRNILIWQAALEYLLPFLHNLLRLNLFATHRRSVYFLRIQSTDLSYLFCGKTWYTLTGYTNQKQDSKRSRKERHSRGTETKTIPTLLHTKLMRWFFHTTLLWRQNPQGYLYLLNQKRENTNR